jgi:hypothetical protein
MYPCLLNVLSGRFSAETPNPTYAQGGLKGHPGVDEKCGYGTPIHSLYDLYIYKILTVQRPSNDGTGFTGVFGIHDDGIECFEWLVGHCDPSVSEGDFIAKGAVIGTEANHGQVFSGNIEITVAMQKAGNHEGAHRHYQKRPVMPITFTTLSDEYLTSYGGSAFRSPEGFYYKTFNYFNGYNGCIDPVRPVFYRDLCAGMSGYDVFVLQRILFRKGFMTAQPTGFFGTATVKAVTKYQSSLGITPTSYFGPLTRAQALRELAPLPVLSNQ